MLPGGLCNLSMDPECRDTILQSGGISLVTNCLSSRREETVLSAITTLMNLTTPLSRSDITDAGILQCMLRFSLSESPRLRNLAAVFLQDCCTEEQVARAEQQMHGQQTAVGIPLPEDWVTADIFMWEYFWGKTDRFSLSESIINIWHYMVKHIWELKHCIHMWFKDHILTPLSLRLQQPPLFWFQSAAHLGPRGNKNKTNCWQKLRGDSFKGPLDIYRTDHKVCSVSTH